MTLSNSLLQPPQSATATMQRHTRSLEIHMACVFYRLDFKPPPPPPPPPPSSPPLFPASLLSYTQDFEALTPNLLARTVETVEGGGLVVLLLRTMSSLRQLYTLSMDVHARYRTEAHQDVVGRFNERCVVLCTEGKRVYRWVLNHPSSPSSLSSPSCPSSSLLLPPFPPLPLP